MMGSRRFISFGKVRLKHSHPQRKPTTTTREILNDCWAMTRARMIEVTGNDPGERVPMKVELFRCDWCHKDYDQEHFGHVVTYKEVKAQHAICVYCEDKLEQMRLDAEYEPEDDDA